MAGDFSVALSKMVEDLSLQKVYISENFDINDFSDELLKQMATKIAEIRKENKIDPKETELISAFPPEMAGSLADVLSKDSHFENKKTGAMQIVNSLKNAIEKRKIAELSKSGDLEKIKEILKKRKN